MGAKIMILSKIHTSIQPRNANQKQLVRKHYANCSVCVGTCTLQHCMQIHMWESIHTIIITY